jgi:elongation factor G
MDRTGADFIDVVSQMNENLDAGAFPFQLPIGSEDDFNGIIDVIEQKAYIFKDYERIESEIPDAYKIAAAEAKANLVEKLSEFDDEVMEMFLEDREIPLEKLKKVARKATLNLLITPVFCGAAYKNKGIQLILDAVTDYLPSPVDVGSVVGVDIDDEEKTHTRCPSVKSPFAALAFKLIHDPFVGQQTFIRIYSGTLKSGMQVYNATRGKMERIGRLMRIHAKNREEITEAGPGEIVALIGMKVTKTGDTLCDLDQRLLLESINIPPSVIENKIMTKSRKDQERLGEALHKLSSEDPSFNVRFDEETEETIISGMGELHLEIIIDRLKHEFSVDVEVGEPSVAYRETITIEMESEYRHAKQSGGKGQFAQTSLRIEPYEGKGYEFVDHIKGGAVPTEFVPSVNKGIMKTLAEGVIAGYPVVDVRVTLFDGKHHAVDSSDMAFQLCGAMCFKQGFKKANPVLLEPMMKVEVNTPDEYIGEVVGNLNRRRGKVESMRRYRKGSQKVVAFVPLSEMFGYATQLRNISSGRANYSMDFHRYAPVSKSLQEEILKKVAEKKVEEK